MNTPVYDVDYFIAKFEAIPESQWCCWMLDNSNGQRCALGHCGVKLAYELTPEAKRLEKLFKPFRMDVPSVNNSQSKKFPQPTPRARILAALHEIKSKEAK